MQTEPANPAKIAFFYLLSLVALILTALPAGMIIFQVINKFVRDNFSTYTSRYDSGSVIFGISAILVAAPIYFWLMREIEKNIKTGRLNLDSPIRKMLTYLILFISSVVSIGWLIGTINSFFSGEYTLKFILKALTAIGISMCIFSYYLLDMKRKSTEQEFKLSKPYFYGALAVILAAFITGAVLESPVNARARRHDEIVINRLELIENNINAFYTDKKALPPKLDLLADNVKYFMSLDDLKDPQSGQGFRYEILSDKKYQLCAQFMAKSADQTGFDTTSRKWEHEIGEKCFEREVIDYNLQTGLKPEMMR